MVALASWCVLSQLTSKGFVFQLESRSIRFATTECELLGFLGIGQSFLCIPRPDGTE